MARRRSGRKIDSLRWEFFSTGSSALALGAGNVGFNTHTAATQANTWMRLRGSVTAWMDGAATPAAAILVSIGMAVVPEGADTTPAWSPFSDGNAPWLYHTTFVLGYEEHVTDVVDSPVLSGYREVIDSKAMRRIRADQEVQIVIENTTIGGADSINVVVAGRALIGL